MARALRFLGIVLLGFLEVALLSGSDTDTSGGWPFPYRAITPPPDSSVPGMSRLCFSVKACRDVRVLLLDESNRQKSNHCYGVGIGHQNNTSTIIRNQTAPRDVAVLAQQPGPLSCSESRSFYVSWDKGLLKVARVKNGLEELLVKYDTSEEFPIRFIYVSAWNDSSVWHMDFECQMLANTSTDSTDNTVRASDTTDDTTKAASTTARKTPIAVSETSPVPDTLMTESGLPTALTSIMPTFETTFAMQPATPITPFQTKSTSLSSVTRMPVMATKSGAAAVATLPVLKATSPAPVSPPRMPATTISTTPATAFAARQTLVTGTSSMAATTHGATTTAHPMKMTITSATSTTRPEISVTTTSATPAVTSLTPTAASRTAATTLPPTFSTRAVTSATPAVMSATPVVISAITPISISTPSNTPQASPPAATSFETSPAGSTMTVTAMTASSTSKARLCPCRCVASWSKPFWHMPPGQNVGRNNVIGHLEIPRNATSTFRRSRTSAEDGRTSSAVIGVTGVLCVVSPLALAVFCDLLTLFRRGGRCGRKCRVVPNELIHQVNLTLSLPEEDDTDMRKRTSKHDEA